MRLRSVDYNIKILIKINKKNSQTNSGSCEENESNVSKVALTDKVVGDIVDSVPNNLQFLNKTRESIFKQQQSRPSIINMSTTTQQQQQQRKKLTMEDYFYQKMYSDLLVVKPTSEKKTSGGETKNTAGGDNKTKSRWKKLSLKKPKYKSYHTRLLEKSIEESYQSRGKMQKYVDYNAFNSDDDSDDDTDGGGGEKHQSGLFQRYGLESRMWNDIAMRARNKTDELPKWSKHVINKKEAAAVENNSSKNSLKRMIIVNSNKKKTPAPAAKDNQK